MSSIELKGDFERDGFVVCENFLDRSEIDAALAEARELATGLEPESVQPHREYWGVCSRRLSGEAIDRPGLRAIAVKPSWLRSPGRSSAMIASTMDRACRRTCPTSGTASRGIVTPTRTTRPFTTSP